MKAIYNCINSQILCNLLFGVCQMTFESETYLGALILHLMTEDREKQAWNLLNTHLSHCGYSKPLAVSLLLPLARYLVKHCHNRQCSNIKVNIRLSFSYIFDIRVCHRHIMRYQY